MDKYERCVMAVKAKDSGYNPWAVCTKTVGRKGGRPSDQKIRVNGREKRVYVGPRGGQFYIEKERKVYL